jgi:hypothetical protein
MTAFTAKFKFRWIWGIALWASLFQFGSALATELHTFWILKLALRAFHLLSL